MNIRGWSRSIWRGVDDVCNSSYMRGIGFGASGANEDMILRIERRTWTE